MPKSPSGAPLHVTVLGTGDAFASRGRFQSGYMVEANGYRILMEAGPTAICAMKRLNFAPADIDLILISHLHGDHFAGLPFLLLDYVWEKPRRTNLTIAGPKRLEERTWRLFRTMFPRPSGAVEKIARKLKFVVIEPGCDVKFGKARVSAIRTPHMKQDVSLALKVALDGKTMVFSGDSGWTEDLVAFSAGADLFLCECTYFDSAQLDFHMNYPQLAANRGRFDVGRFVLTHIGREVLDREGEVQLEMAFDGMKIRV